MLPFPGDDAPALRSGGVVVLGGPPVRLPDLSPLHLLDELRYLPRDEAVFGDVLGNEFLIFLEGRLKLVLEEQHLVADEAESVARSLILTVVADFPILLPTTPSPAARFRVPAAPALVAHILLLLNGWLLRGYGPIRGIGTGHLSSRLGGGVGSAFGHAAEVPARPLPLRRRARPAPPLHALHHLSEHLHAVGES